MSMHGTDIRLEPSNALRNLRQRHVEQIITIIDPFVVHTEDADGSGTTFPYGLEVAQLVSRKVNGVLEQPEFQEDSYLQTCPECVVPVTSSPTPYIAAVAVVGAIAGIVVGKYVF